MGAYTEIVDFTFTANETSRTFSGLSITKDDFLRIDFTLVNGSSSNSAVHLFPNTNANVSGFNTITNYSRQLLEGGGTGLFALRGNTNEFGFTAGNQQNFQSSYFKISENNKVNYFGNHYRTLNDQLVMKFVYTTSSNLTFNDPITSLTFTSSVANGLGTGSRIQIYKLAAEKVADITVANNTTQVDISNLSIDKDSEYLLVSHLTRNDSSEHFLCVNDNTTLSNYNTQLIFGSGSSAGAERLNDPRFINVASSNFGIAYTHIKLSNIGAYTFQSYQIRDASDIQLLNWFGSSTAENITSITKLNIISDVTSGIAAGSRFTLYKLYE